MAYYLFQARYSRPAIQAMIDEPQNREEAARPLIEALGGKLLSLFFCFGQEDVLAIIEAPDDKTAAASSMILGASGAFSAGATTKLLSAAEAMEAMGIAKQAQGIYSPATG
ncbi:MAG: GYD domain-containing protein [Pseudomonadota bacterium]